MKTILKVFGLLAVAFPGSFSVSAETVPATTGDGIVQMSELDLSNITCYNGSGIAVRANKSTQGNPITMKGIVYESGVGTHAPSKAVVDLKGATEFYCLLGLDDEAKTTPDGAGVVDYTVTLYKDKEPEVRLNGTAKRTDAEPVTVSLSDLADYDYMVLDIATGTYSWDDHVDFADARFVYSGEEPVIITEKNMYPDPNKPAIIELPAAGANGEEIIPLSSLDISLCTNGWGTIKANKSIDGNTLTIKGQEYASGIGMHATGKVCVKLNGAVTAFHAVLGIDDEVADGKTYSNGEARCYYKVVLIKQNGEERVISNGEISHADGTIAVVDIVDGLSDYKYLVLDFDEGSGNGSDHVDVANAYFEYVEQNSTRPEMVNEKVLATGLDCATTLFSQPGVRFMHKLRSNNPDLLISVMNLPAGLSFNESRCLVEGIIEAEGEYTYTAVTTMGENTKEIPVKLTVSSNLQQPTPHMGWLSWNVVQGDISDEVVRQAADNMISSGLFDAGYNYVLMDDLWHGTREPGTNKPRPDATRFPNGVKVLADYVHERGMKFGLYSDAADKTCAGAFGSYNKETIDAKQYAEWGIDYLKYDYCHAPSDVETAKTRYYTMGRALANSGRHIVFNICEWGVRSPWEWGAEALGSSWRATYDVRDGWVGVSGGIGMVQSVDQMKDVWAYTGVNRWNDADMLCVGINGTGKSSSALVQSAGMTKTEYRSQFAMWCMWSSPLALSFDIRKPISDVDLAIMTNPELIAIDQDRMGQAAEYLGVDGNECYLFAKDLENGDVAVAVINMSSKKQTFTFDFSKIPALDSTVTYSVRDLQNRKDCPDATGSIADVSVAKHETVVYRLHDKAKDTGDSGLKAIADGALEEMTVSAADWVVTVCLNGTEGASKRVLVSDLVGRVVGSATSSSACVNVPVRSAAGVYVVNVIGGGHTRSVKVRL